ncbi:MAG: hypothetical protein ACOCUP_00710, partial [bacterium]
MFENNNKNIRITSKSQNPFVGIRPLSMEESHLFFGRDKPVELILRKLRNDRFVIVSGGSGVGKSSLVNCGLIPKMREEGNWKSYNAEITDSPLKSFYSHILQITENSAGKPFDFNESGIKKTDLISLLKEDYRKTQSNYLFFIDQIEQLLITEGRKNAEEWKKNIFFYFSLLFDLVEEEDIPIYIIMAIRSDFLEEFSTFTDSAKLISKYNYLLPQMDDNELREVITGSLNYSGADWDKQLADRMIRDLSSRTDKLSLMQYVLLRTFDSWKESGLEGEPMGLKNYEEVGTVSHVVEHNAEKAYNNLDEKKKKLCERIFKSLAWKTANNEYLKLNAKIGDIAQIAQVEEYQVIKVANVFNKSRYALLNPPQNTLLTEDTYLGLSHEVLIRTWPRLKEWIDEEAESIAIYKDLAEAAFYFQLGKAELWTPPELDKAVAWRDQNQPNMAWAQRHNSAFERTMVFLNFSENEYHHGLERKKRARIIRTLVAGALSVVVGILVVFFLFFQLRPSDSRDKSSQVLSGKNGNQESSAGLNEEATSQSEDDFAEEGASFSGQRQEEARQPDSGEQEEAALVRRRENVQSQGQETEEQISEATEEPGEESENTRNNTRFTDPLGSISDELSDIAQTSEDDVGPGTGEEVRESLNPMTAGLVPSRIRDILDNIAQSSIEVKNDQDLKSLLAYQSFLFNNEYNNGKYNPVIYEALYTSIRAQIGSSFNAYEGHSNAVRTLDFLPNSNTFLSAGSDGRVLKWSASGDNTQYSVVLSGRGILEAMMVSPDGRWLIASESRKGILLMNLTSGSS